MLIALTLAASLQMAHAQPVDAAPEDAEKVEAPAAEEPAADAPEAGEAPASDEGTTEAEAPPAVAPVVEAPASATPNRPPPPTSAAAHPYALADYDRGRQMTNIGYGVGIGSTVAVVGGVGLVFAGALGVASTGGTGGNLGTNAGLVLGGFGTIALGGIGLYTGAGLVNGGAAISTRAANELGAGLPPGSTPGWIFFGVSFIPYIGWIALPVSYVLGAVKQGAAGRAFRNMNFSDNFEIKLTPMVNQKRLGLQLAGTF